MGNPKVRPLELTVSKVLGRDLKLLEAYQDDPLSVSVYLRMRFHYNRMQRQPQRYANFPRARQVLETFPRILPPVLAATKGESLAAFADRLKDIVAPLEQRKDWAIAQQYLLELLSIQPDDIDVVARSARAVAMGGAVDRASGIVRAAIARGMDRAQLMQHPALQPILGALRLDP